MSAGARWLRAISDSEWRLVASDSSGGVLANPTAYFPAPTIQSLLARVDASKSFSTNGPITAYSWDFGDGGTSTAVAVDHTYTYAGTYTIRLSVTDSTGQTSSMSRDVQVSSPASGGGGTPQPVAPIARFTSSAAGLTVTFDASASTDADGQIVSYRWSWGDGTQPNTVSANTIAHTYASGGPFSVTLVVTDNTGRTGTTSGTANPVFSNGGGGGSSGASTDPAVVSPWKSGDPMEGIPSSVRVYTARQLQPSGALELQTMINALPADGVIDVGGQQVFISSFSNSSYPSGATGSRFLGLIGGISGGQFDNQITLKADALTQAQANTVASQQRGETSTVAIIRVPGNKPVYMAGVHFVGADQPIVTEANSGAQFPTGPARMKGLDLDLAAPGIFQNCLLEGWGASNGSTPPWEVGSVDSRRSTLFQVRRVEMDGRLPVGSPSRPQATTSDPMGWNWSRTGGFQWNADKSPRMTNFSLHDAHVSGLTLSIAGTGNNGSNNTEDPVFDHVYVANNSVRGFPGINLESLLGPAHFNYCTFIMNGSGSRHITLNPILTSVKAPNIPSEDLVFLEPSWNSIGSNPLFTIGIAGYGTAQTSDPTVIVNGRPLAATFSSTGDPTSQYRIIKL